MFLYFFAKIIIVTFMKGVNNSLKFIKQILLSFLAFILFINNISLARASLIPAPDTSKVKSAIVYDNDNKQILYQKNVHQSLPIASLTKLLTVLTVEQNTDDTDLANKQILVHDNNLVKFSLNPNYSNIPLALNQSYSLQTLIQMAMFNSSDAAALALANSDYDLFNREMLKTAKSLNLHDEYHFYNAVGLQNGDMDIFKNKSISDKADNSMSAYDLAKVSDCFISKNPTLLTNVTSQSSYQFGNKKYNNSNKFLTNPKLNTTKIKIDGLKTGTSNSAGNNLITTGTYQGRRLTFIVLGASKDADRYTTTNNLMNYVVREYKLFNLHDIKFTPTNVTNGRTDSVKPVVTTNKIIWIQNSSNQKRDLNRVIDEKITDNNAPLYTNKAMGKVVVHLNTINGKKQINLPLYPDKNVLKPLTLWQKILKCLPVAVVLN